MTLFERTQIVEGNGRASPARGKGMFAGILLVVMIATVGTRNMLPTEALAPAIVTLLFAIAAATIGLALLCRRDRLRTMWYDLGGALAFIGIVISVLIEPDQMVRLFSFEQQPE